MAKQYETVDISTGKVKIRRLTRGDMRTWRKSHNDDDGKVNDEKLEYSDDVLIALSLMNGNGTLKHTVSEAMDGCFDDMTHEDGRILISRIIDLNRIGEDVKSLKVAAKN